MEREVETLMGLMPRMRKMLKESDAQEVHNVDYDNSFGHQHYNEYDDDDVSIIIRLTLRCLK